MEGMDETYDFVVVGSGGGSMCAGLVMRKAGKSVLVLEKTDLLGGSTAIAQGHPLMRDMLDAASVAQHAFLSEGTITAAGAAMFDEPTMPGYP